MSDISNLYMYHILTNFTNQPNFKQLDACKNTDMINYTILTAQSPKSQKKMRQNFESSKSQN